MIIPLEVPNTPHKYRLTTNSYGYDLQRLAWVEDKGQYRQYKDGGERWEFTRFYPTIGQAAKGIWKEHLVNQCDTLEELRKEQGLFIDTMSKEVL